MAVVMCLALGYGQSAAVTIVPGGIGDELDGLYDMRIVDSRTAAGWQNFIVIENTSGNWTAVDLRFRAHKCSIEVWDKVILLSPYDVFWAALSADGQGGVTIWSEDYDTLYNSGLIRVVGERYEGAFSTNLMDEIGQVSSLDYGHIEAIGLFQLSMPRDWNSTTDTHYLHEVVLDLYPRMEDGGTGPWPDGLINVYDVLQAAYYEFSRNIVPQPGEGWITRRPGDLRINVWETPPQVAGIANFDERRVLDCDNVLTGNFIWGDLVTAEMGMENMIAMEDFRLNDWARAPFGPPIPQNQWSLIHRDGHFSGAIVFPPQHVYREAAVPGRPGGLSPDYWCTYAPYLNPDWATQWGATLRDGDALCVTPAYPIACNPQVNPGDDPLLVDQRVRFNDIWSQIDVDWAYAKTEVWYNYFQEEPFGLGTGIYTTDVYFTLKTKYLNSISCNFPFWNISGWWPCNDLGIALYHEAVANARYAGLCNLDNLYLNVTVWDMDENLPPIGPELPSPGVWSYPIYIDEETTISRFSTEPGPLYDPTVFFSPWLMGHFRVDSMFYLGSGFRYARYWNWFPGSVGLTLPTPDAPGLFGLVYFRHTFGAEDFIRSAMAEWHYRLIGGIPCPLPPR